MSSSPWNNPQPHSGGPGHDAASGGNGWNNAASGAGWGGSASGAGWGGSASGAGWGDSASGAGRGDAASGAGRGDAASGAGFSDYRFGEFGSPQPSVPPASHGIGSANIQGPGWALWGSLACYLVAAGFGVYNAVIQRHSETTSLREANFTLAIMLVAALVVVGASYGLIRGQQLSRIILTAWSIVVLVTLLGATFWPMGIAAIIAGGLLWLPVNNRWFSTN